MGIPDFTSRGVLPKGLHIASPKEFIDRFCTHELGEYRFNYVPIIDNILGFCKQRGAVSIFFTGSFVTDKEIPSDLDCIVVFKSDKSIPNKESSFIVDHGQIDVAYCSIENDAVLKNLLKLYSIDKYDIEVGIVHVELDLEYEYSWPYYDNDEDELMLYREAYHHRHVSKSKQKNGLIIALHGIRCKGEWLLKLAPVASANNWIYAPFFYGYKYPNILVSNPEKMKVLEDFRVFVKEVSDKYGMTPNIIAHSFGTYIIGNYLDSFNNNPPVRLGNIILSGSILTSEFNWTECIENESVLSIYNEVAPNDNWVPHIEKTSWLKKDELFGKAGTEGFTDTHNRVLNNTIKAYTHGNMLEEDIFEKRWIPHLNIVKNINKFNNIGSVQNSVSA